MAPCPPACIYASTNVMYTLSPALTLQTVTRSLYCICSVIFHNAKDGANSREGGSFAFSDLILTLLINIQNR